MTSTPMLRCWRRKKNGRAAARPPILYIAFVLIGTLSVAHAKAVPEINDLPVPFSLQGTIINKTAAITWQWQPPEHRPQFQKFVYEVKRQDGKVTSVPRLSFSDFDLAFGTYTYQVRAWGLVKFHGQKSIHVSDWSEPITVISKVSCPQAPTLSMTVHPTQSTYSSVASFRVRLVGDVQVPEGCTLLHTRYHIDTGTGITHEGPLRPNAQGHFDQRVDALGPEDEVPTGRADFSITATAEDEAGAVTSEAYTVSMELSNPYAPR